ncbi:MAG: phosphatidylglycerophosphatase A [Gammaproteobacteria bacterium]|jgi:phosphatidylglycerophosphatase A
MANTDRLSDSRNQQKGKIDKRNPVHWLAVGLGSGLAPRAPGTAGTLVAVPLVLLSNGLPVWQYIFIVLAGLVAGIWICGVAARQMGVHDDPAIVWDEIIGFLITMTAAPPGWLWMVIGFVLFRFFDIAKPWPIRAVDQRLGGGLGIMLDDVLAGLYALVVLQVVIRIVL